MALFHYTALDARGDTQSGLERAREAALLRQRLRDRGLAPLEIHPARWQHHFMGAWRKGQAGPVLSRRALQQALQQLAVLLEGGLPLEKALSLLAAQQPTPQASQRLYELQSKLREGLSLSEAMAAHPQDFTEMVRATVAAGERTGRLAYVLNDVAASLEQQLATQQKIRLALFYPVMLAVFALSITAFMLVFIVPDLAKAFTSSGRALPWLTRAVMALSDVVQWVGIPLLLLVVAAVAWFRNSLKNPVRRLAWHRRLLTLPLIGRLLAEVEMTAFINSFSMLLQSGVTLADSMRAASQLVKNQALKRELLQATERVCEGLPVSEALMAVSHMPPALLGLIQGGEASSELARTAVLAARQQNRALQSRASWFLSILEPCIILATGLLVLLIVLAMMMPILSLNQLVGL